jgi:UDP-glucose 4-epimerase
MKKAIVFGGAGFVGSHVADALTKVGFETTIFDIKEPKYKNKSQIFIKGDILNQSLIDDVVKGKDYIYHLAGQPDIEISFQKPKETLSLNIQGTINILEAAIKNSIERFVFASTLYVYSDAGGFYKASKQACEIIIEEYQKQFGLGYTILRYGSLYGPRSDESNAIHFIIKQALLHKVIKIPCDSDEKRDYIHVLDAARMSVDILSADYKNSHVMLTGYQHISRGELLNTIKEMLGDNIQIISQKLDVDKTHGHYKFTPYAFRPQVSKKLVSRDYIEFGQGLLTCIEEIYEKFVYKDNDGN